MANGALETLRGFARRWVEAGVIGVVLAVAFGPPLVEHAKNASDSFRFADDARILIPPLYRAGDPALFPNDPVSDYYAAGLPDALRLLYSLVSPLAGPEALSKILPYLLLALAVGCLGVTAHRLGGKPAVLGAVALALGSAHVLGRVVAGLPRAFALPLLLAGALALVLGRPVALAALAVIAAAFYPVAGVLLGLSLLGWFLMPARDRGFAATFSVRRRVAVLAITALGMALVVLPSALRLRAYGPAIDASLARDFPEAGEFGRFDPPDRPPFPPLPVAAAEPLGATLVGDGTPLFPPLNGRSQGTALAIWIFVTAGFGWVVLARRRAEARRFLVLPAAVVVAHTLSLPFTPHLFLPERYVAYGLAAVALVGVPTAFSFLLEHARTSVKFVPLAWNVFVLLVLGARGTSWAGLTVLVPPAERPLYASIARLPKTAVVAGWPGQVIDNVPYLARRTAFVTRETHMPFHRDYTLLMRQRMRALIAAYYASDPEPLRALRQRHGVTHVIVDRRHFAAPPPYFAPFDAEARAAFAAGRAKGFELERAVERGEASEVGGLVLVDLHEHELRAAEEANRQKIAEERARDEWKRRERENCRPLADVCEGKCDGWDKALRDARRTCAENPMAELSVSMDCGGYHFIRTKGIDTLHKDYYSSQSLELVGMSTSGYQPSCTGTVPEVGACQGGLSCQRGELVKLKPPAPCTCKPDDPLCSCL